MNGFFVASQYLFGRESSPTGLALGGILIGTGLNAAFYGFKKIVVEERIDKKLFGQKLLHGIVIGGLSGIIGAINFPIMEISSGYGKIIVSSAVGFSVSAISKLYYKLEGQKMSETRGTAQDERDYFFKSTIFGLLASLVSGLANVELTQILIHVLFSTSIYATYDFIDQKSKIKNGIQNCFDDQRFFDSILNALAISSILEINKSYYCHYVEKVLLNKEKSELSGQIMKFKVMNTELIDRNVKLVKENTNLNANNFRLTEQNSKLSAEILKLKNTNSTLNANNLILTENISTLRVDNVTLKNEINALNAEGMKLSKENENLYERISEFNKQNGQIINQNAVLRTEGKMNGILNTEKWKEKVWKNIPSKESVTHVLGRAWSYVYSKDK